MKFALFLLAAGCSAAAAATFLIFQVERGAVDAAVRQYVLAGVLGLIVPALCVVALRRFARLRGFVPCSVAWSVVAGALGATFATLLLRL